MNLTYKWVNRALNSRADELSRPTPTEWRINEKGMAILRKDIFGINLRVIRSIRLGLPAVSSPFDTYVVIPEFNAVGFTIATLRKRQFPAWIVYPIWRAQSWWYDIVHNTVDRTVMGPLTEFFTPVGQVRIQPPWIMEWSLVLPEYLLDARKAPTGHF